jgi:1-acyl-sn-glycerol-3-phosphate acyltransferase
MWNEIDRNGLYSIVLSIFAFIHKGEIMFQNIWYQIGRSIVDFYARRILKADIHKPTPFPKGAKIIAVNHPSTTDPAWVTALTREQMIILIKETVFKVPVFGRSLRLSGHVPVVAGNGRAALETGINLLKAGKTVVIFPEGVISPDRGMHKAHTGVARLALATGAPVFPVGISLNPRKKHLIHTIIDGEPETLAWYMRGPYAMTVGDPVAYQGDPEDREQVRSITGQIMQQIDLLCHQSESRLAHRAASRSARLGLATPKTALQVAWKGTWTAFEQSARVVLRSPAFRTVESVFLVVMMYARSL